MQGASSDRKRAPRRVKKSRLSRRRFMALLAGGALAAATPAAAVTMRTGPRKAAAATPARSAAIEKGIGEQKGFLAKQLKTLREFPLPPGSDPAFLFRPVSPRRMR